MVKFFSHKNKSRAETTEIRKNAFSILVLDFQQESIFRWARCRFQKSQKSLHPTVHSLPSVLSIICAVYHLYSLTSVQSTVCTFYLLYSLLSVPSSVCTVCTNLPYSTIYIVFNLFVFYVFQKEKVGVRSYPPKIWEGKIDQNGFLLGG